MNNLENIQSLVIDQLTVNYGNTPILWDISLKIPDKGNIIGIIGPNGAGKTTLVKTCLNMIKPLTGKISFWGESFKKVRKKIAYIPQRTSVDWDFPIQVLDLVLMGRYGKLGLFKRPKKADISAALYYLKQVEMDAFAHRQINELSGGQQQRVFLARALLQEAELYFLDEPFSAVDLATEKIILSLLHQLKQNNKIIFIIHHDLNTVKTFFDMSILLNMRLIAYGKTQDVLTNDNIKKTFGTVPDLLAEAYTLSQRKSSGYF